MDNVSDGIELWYVVDWLADKLVYQYVINKKPPKISLRWLS